MRGEVDRSGVGTVRDLVVVATYNERENLPRLLPEIWAAAPDVDILVIDDNSPDGTGQWVESQLEREPRLKYLPRERKLGLGTAAVAAMRYAIEHGYRYLINMDADFSHDPSVLPQLIAAMEPADGRKVDVAIGSRYVPGGGTHGWPWYRRWMSRAVNVYARCWLRLPLRDCSSGYRCFRVATLERLELDRVRAHGYVFHEEILWHLKRAGAVFAEIPILFVDRQFGQSKIRLTDAFAALWRIGQLGIRDRLSRPRTTA